MQLLRPRQSTYTKAEVCTINFCATLRAPWNLYQSVAYNAAYSMHILTRCISPKDICDAVTTTLQKIGMKTTNYCLL